MTAGFVSAAYVCVGVLTLLFFFTSSLLLLQHGSEADGRSPPPSRYVYPPSLPLSLSLSRLPAVLMVGLWGAGYKGGKEAKMEKGKKALICFYLTVFELDPGTLGDRC